MIVDIHTHVWEHEHLSEKFVSDARITSANPNFEIAVDLDRHWAVMEAVDKAVVLGFRARHFAGKCAVHVHFVQGRATRPLSAGALAELRHQDHPPTEFIRFQVMAKPIDRDLSLVFIAVRAAETTAPGGCGAPLRVPFTTVRGTSE